MLTESHKVLLQLWVNCPPRKRASLSLPLELGVWPRRRLQSLQGSVSVIHRLQWQRCSLCLHNNGVLWCLASLLPLLCLTSPPTSAPELFPLHRSQGCSCHWGHRGHVLTFCYMVIRRAVYVLWLVTHSGGFKRHLPELGVLKFNTFKAKKNDGIHELIHTTSTFVNLRTDYKPPPSWRGGDWMLCHQHVVSVSGLWHRMESSWQTDGRDCGCEEDLWRLQEQDGRPGVCVLDVSDHSDNEPLL